MKKIKIKIGVVFTLLLMTLAVLFGPLFKTDVYATGATKVEVTYKVYKPSDYQNLLDYDYYQKDLSNTMWDVLYGVAPAAAQGQWASKTATGDSTKTCLRYWGDYPNNLSISGTADETTQFAPNDSVVIAPFMKMTGAQFAGGHVRFDISGYSNTVEKWYVANETSINETSTGTAIGWQYTNSGSTTYADGATVSLGAIQIKLDNIANGPVTIQFDKSGSQVNATAAYDKDGTSYNCGNSVFSGGETTRTIQVMGATSNTDVKKIKIAGTDYDVTSATDITVNSDVTIGPNTDCPSYTLGTTTNKIYVSGTSFTFDGTIADLGSVTQIKWGDTIANAWSGTGTKAGSSTGTAPYTVPLSAFGTGDTIVVLAEVTASNGTTKQWVNVNVQKAPDTTAVLEGATFAVTGPTSTYTLKQATSTYADTSTTGFSSSVKYYNLYIPGDASKLELTPSFDSTTATNHHQTCKVNGNSNNGVVVEISHANGAIVPVEMTAQDGETKETYYFKVKHVSTATELTSLAWSAGSQNGTATYNSGTKTYTITGIDYANGTVTLTPTFPANAQGWQFDGAALDKTAKTVTFSAAANNYAQFSEPTKQFIVTSQAGNTETYNVDITRNEADKTKGITKVEIIYTDPATSASVTKQANLNGTTYEVIGSDSLPFKVPSYKVKLTLANTTTTEWDIGGTNKHLSGQDETVNFVDDAGNAVLSSKTITITPQYKTDTATFNLSVERKAADTNVKLDGLTITSNAGDSYGTFDATNQTFTIADGGNYKFPYSSTYAIVSPAITGLSKVEVKEGTTTLTNGRVNFSGINDDSHSISIVIKPEYGSSVSIPVTVVRGGADNHTDFELTVTASQTQTASGDTSVITTSTGSPYEFNVDYGTASVQIDIAAFTDSTHGTQSTSTKFYLDTIGTLMSGNTATINFTPTDKTKQTRNIDIYFYTSAYPYLNSSSTYAKKITVTAIRAAANNNTTMTWDITNTSGTEATTIIGTVTDSSISKTVTGNKTKYIIDITSTQNGFSDSKFKIKATASASTSTIYWSNDSSNLTQNVLAAADEFQIGSYPTLNIVYLTIEAQFGNKVTYEIQTITPDNRNPDNKIIDIALDNYTGYTFNSTQTTPISIPVPYTTGTMVFTVTKNVNVSKMTYKVDGVTKGTGLGSGAATAVTGTINLTAGGTTKVEIFLEAERDNVAGTTYTFNIQRAAGQTANNLTAVSINGVNLYTQNNINVLAPYNQNSTSMVFVVDSSVNSANLQFTVSGKAKYYITDVTNTYSDNGFTDLAPAEYNGFGISNTAPTEIQISVYSEVQQYVTGTPTPKKYTIYVYSASQNKTIDNVELYKDSDMNDYIVDTNDNAFDYSTITTSLNNPFTVPFAGNSAMYVSVVTPTGAASTVNINGGTNYDVSLTTTSKKVTVTVISQLGMLLGSTNPLYNTQVETYDFYVKRNPASTVSTLDSLVVTGGGNTLTFKEGAFNSTTKSYAIENLPDSITQIEFTYTKTDPRSSTTASPSPYVFTTLSDTVTESITITVYSEEAQDKINNGLTSNNYSTYEVKFSRKPIVYDSNNEVSITAYDQDALYYIGGTSTQQFNMANPGYTVNLAANVGSVTILVSKPTTKSKLSVVVNDGTTTETLTSPANEKNLTNPFAIQLDPATTKTLTVTCIAEDSTPSIDYVITIKRADYEDIRTLSSLSYNGTPIGLINGKYSYTVKVPNSVDTVYLEGVPTSTNSYISSNDAPQASPVSLVVGTNPSLSIVVTSQKSLSQPYTVIFERDEVATLSDLQLTDDNNIELEDADGNKYLVFDSDPEASKKYTISVPYEISKVNLVPTLAATDPSLIKVTYSGNAINQLGNATLAEGLNTLKVTLTPNSGINPQAYTVEITRASGNGDNYIETYKYYDNLSDKASGTLTELSVNRTDRTYDYSVSKDILVFEPEITVSQDATFEMPASTTIVPGTKNVFKVTVKSQKGTPRDYTFNVYSADHDFEIEDINVLDKQNGTDVKDIVDDHIVEYNGSTISYNLTVPYSTANIYLDVLTAKSTSTVMLSKDGGTTYNAFTSSLQPLKENDITTFKVYVISEYGKLINDPTVGRSDVYTINITRNEADGDSRIDELTITYGSETYTWDATLDDAQVIGTSEQYQINKDNIGESTTSITISAKATSKAAKVTGVGLKTLDDLSVSSGSISGYIFTFTVEVTSEKGNVNKYNITVSRGPLDLDNDNSINYITLTDSQGAEYLEAQWNEGKKEYEVTIPYGPQSYTISAIKNKAATSSTTGAGQFVITYPTTGNYEKTHIVYATSANGTPGIKYEIKVTALAPSHDATLKSISINNVPITPFDKDQLKYATQTLDNSIKSISVSAVPNDPNATVTGDLGDTIFLAEGNNSIIILVTAQDKKTTNTYVLTVPRDYPTPYLTDLEVAGEALLNELDKATTFDKDTLTYHSIVSYTTLKATINASVDNLDHTVSSSNATVTQNKGNTRQFETILNEGANNYTIVVKSTAGKTQEYKLVITRRPESSTNTSIRKINVSNLDKPTEVFPIEYSDLTSTYNIEVPNSVRNLNVEATVEEIASATGEGATYEVFNNSNLKSGEVNKVLVLVTAEDGETTRAVLINVTRKPMEFTVNKEATSFNTAALNEAKYQYQIDLGESKASDIADYTKYIVAGEGCDLDVEVLSDTTKADCREVIVKVSDGYEEKLVSFTLNTTEKPTSSFDYIVWILLGLGLIILIIILILVNKDKYGAVSNKRKKA